MTRTGVAPALAPIVGTDVIRGTYAGRERRTPLLGGAPMGDDMSVVDRTQAGAAVTGLSQVEAARRLSVDGPNQTRPPARPSIYRRIGRQLSDPLILVLLAAAVVTAATFDVADTIVILLVITVNTIIGVAQEVRAERAIAALRDLSAPTCRVVRDGADRIIPAADVVRGDVIRLAGGDIVPADASVLDAHRLSVDESSLTGESVAVDRGPGDELFAGTVVASGRADATVTRIGADSALGRLVTITERARPGPTPLQRRLARLGRVLSVWIIALSAVVTAVGVVGGRSPLQMAIVGVSLVVAAVPESLPAVVTLALALGARRMAAAHALTRRLAAVEALGSVDLLLSDKTGTLTQGRMAVHVAVTADGAEYTIAGEGYDPAGSIHSEPHDADGADLTALATAGVLCNDAELVPPTSKQPAWSVTGDQLEGALLTFAARAGTDIERTRTHAPRIGEQPFDQRTRMMITEHRDASGDQFVACKGAPEAVLGADNVACTAEQRARLLAVTDRLARDGLRTLAFAVGPPDRLRPLGVVGIGDPLRDNAPITLRQLGDAGVRTVIVTGDHPTTAQRIAAQAGIWQPGDTVVNCAEPGWQSTDPRMVRVFARAKPDQKLGLVQALQQSGATVAVTGDGVNDAPALRRADIGVAMGGGTAIAHQAAQLVLADDDLATLVRAVGEGRRIYGNIRRFLRYALSGGVAEILTMLVGPAVGLAVPLLPAQILWINLLTHGLPGVAMGAEPGSPESMHRPPRPATQSVLGAGLGRAILATGALIAACTLAFGAIAARLDLPWQTLTFLVLGLAQLGVALAVRAPRSAGRNRWLDAAVASSALLMAAAVLAAPLRELLGTEPVSILQAAAAVAVAAIPGLVVAASRRLTRHARPSPAGTHYETADRSSDLVH